jgi:hypothetical protein
MDGWMDGWMDVWMDGWMDGWMAGKAGLRIAYSNQKSLAYTIILTTKNYFKR